MGHGCLLGRTVNIIHPIPTEETGCYMEITREGGRKEAKKPFRILLMLFWDEVREIPNLSKNCSGDFPLCEIGSGPTGFTQEIAWRKREEEEEEAGCCSRRVATGRRTRSEKANSRFRKVFLPKGCVCEKREREGGRGPDVPKLIPQ